MKECKISRGVLISKDNTKKSLENLPLVAQYKKTNTEIRVSRLPKLTCQDT